jgi:ribosomal protein S11
MSIPVFADGNRYLFYEIRYKNFAVKSYSSSYNDTWVSILDNSRSAWNNSNAGTTITT